jgi:hypothetical protein
MRHILATTVAICLLTTSAPQAGAAVCAAGVYRAGCVGARGAVVVRKPIVAPHCYYRAGVRLCR